MNHSKSLLQRITFSALLIGLFIFFVSSSVFAEGAKNIIVMISDGCGYNHIDAASIYQYGKTGTQVYERFPVKYAMATFSAGNFDANGNWTYKGSYDPAQAWTWFEHVKSGYTDSASAATAMSTGVKTYDAGIGVDPAKKPLKHFMQLAEELGKATGVITSVEFSHATPAGFVAHNVSRNDYAGIAKEMILDSKTDVIMGCGNPMFDDNAQPTAKNDYKFVGGKETWEGLLAGLADFDLDGDGVADNSVEDADGDGKPDKWTLIQDVAEFQALMNGDTPKRVIGVPQVYQTLQYNRGTAAGEGYSASDEKIPYETPLNQNVPTLEEMTKSALNVLDNDPDGFTLMVEGGAIDWAAHANSSAREIEEEIDFNKSVEAVIDWVNQNSNWNETLLIVTGDHECGYLTGPNSGPDPDDKNDAIKPVWNPLVNNGADNLPGMEWHSGNHTNSLIPFFAKGAGASLFTTKVVGVDPVRGSYIDNTEIAKVSFDLLSMPSEEYGNVFFMELDKGLNMVSMPLKPENDTTAEDFAKMLGATVVIKYDLESKKFTGYILGSMYNNFMIEGGKGYIVNVEESKTVPFVGAAWTNTPPYQMAPSKGTESAWAFVVAGSFDSSDKGYTVEARNCRTNEVMKGSVSNGYFSLASADLNRNSIIQTGDIIEITINDANDNIVSNTTYTVNNDNINKANIYVPLKLGNLKPSNTCLLQNYPNPFNPETWIPFQLAEECNVKLRIYDMQGKIIRSLDLGRQSAGVYNTRDKAVYWDGHNEDGEVVSSGIYFYEIQAGDFSSIKKMIIQR